MYQTNRCQKMPRVRRPPFWAFWMITIRGDAATWVATTDDNIDFLYLLWYSSTMSEDMIKYPLGRDVETVDGDIRARHDFSSEAYPDLYEAIREPHLILDSVREYFEAEKLHALSRRPATDPEVKKVGSLKECKQRAHDASLRSRAFYLESQGLPAGTTPVDSSREAQDKFDEAVGRWMAFRDRVLKDPGELAALEADAQAKINKFLHHHAA